MSKISISNISVLKLCKPFNLRAALKFCTVTGVFVQLEMCCGWMFLNLHCFKNCSL